mmetsp:Transcript_27862/g.46215  ORF Transcript_27862/g.46215 Transcript_27862/m.46215 type:complete len:97 (+) Transcript_27862:916-1206(+)
MATIFIKDSSPLYTLDWAIWFKPALWAIRIMSNPSSFLKLNKLKPLLLGHLIRENWRPRNLYLHPGKKMPFLVADDEDDSARLVESHNSYAPELPR